MSLRSSLWSLIPFLFLSHTSVFSQQPPASTTPVPTPTPVRTGRSYSTAELTKAPPSPGPQAQSPVRFSDISTESQINFKHEPSVTSMKYLLEAMGGGVAMFDYDNDGRMDLFFTNGALEDVTERSALKGDGYSMGVAAGDYDNDGYVDLYVTGYGENHLYHNNGDGTFTDVTKKLGVSGSGWSTSAGWIDYDRDGRLDLFVGRYVDWDFESGSVYCGENRPGYRAYCHPDNFRGATNILYHQRADGSFEDVSAKAGILEPGGKALGLALADFDNDGWMDIFVANDSVRQSLYHNKGDGSFEDIAVMSGAGYDENGKTYAGMGVDAADYDNDGLMDVFITTLSNETYPLYHNDRDLSFAYATNSSGIGQITLLYSGWGTHFIDVDNDGMRDIFVAQGHVLDTVENVSATAGLAFNTPLKGRGAAFGDLNNDGQIDVVIAQLDGPAVVLRNEGTKNHWLGLSLVGSKSNRDGIGARIIVTNRSGKKQIFDANTSGSYLSANDPRIVFNFSIYKKKTLLTVRLELY